MEMKLEAIEPKSFMHVGIFCNRYFSESQH